jgi:hypothetical protein
MPATNESCESSTPQVTATPSPETVTIIGETAGKVWCFLRERGDGSVSRIAKGTGATTREVERAIGWLAREGKLEFLKTQRGEIVRLTPRG